MKKKVSEEEIYHEHAGSDSAHPNVMAEEMEQLKKVHRENIERAQKDIRVLRETIEGIDLALASDDVDTPNDQGLPPFSASAFAHNIIVADPHNALVELRRVLVEAYEMAEEELRPTFMDYLLYLFVPARRLSMKRHKSVMNILRNLDRIGNILAEKEEGSEVGINLNNFATYVTFLQVVRPQSSSMLFTELRKLAVSGLEHSRKLLKVSKALSK